MHKLIDHLIIWFNKFSCRVSSSNKYIVSWKCEDDDFQRQILLNYELSTINIIYDLHVKEFKPFEKNENYNCENFLI